MHDRIVLGANTSLFPETDESFKQLTHTHKHTYTHHATPHHPIPYHTATIRNGFRSQNRLGASGCPREPSIPPRQIAAAPIRCNPKGGTLTCISHTITTPRIISSSTASNSYPIIHQPPPESWLKKGRGGGKQSSLPSWAPRILRSPMYHHLRNGNTHNFNIQACRSAACIGGHLRHWDAMRGVFPSPFLPTVGGFFFVFFGVFREIGYVITHTQSCTHRDF
ncbi:hypothetical protein F4778DRAFT_750892 [Xylariomycetidae sp. FL2044]|nr:hypothetical protein F4778DRAFT_750892 [Xylariomycetidae sp. FL2044]